MAEERDGFQRVPTRMNRRRSFDRDYYARFYEDDPVHTRTKIAQLAQGVHSFAQWWELDISSVLDIGAGPGYWRDWYAENHPGVEYHSTDVSEHACETYRHEQRDITSWQPRRRYDLVVCHGVLHYLDPAGASAAIENIAAAAKGLLYLEAPTSNDLDTIVDVETTDMNVTRRSAAWYRTRLGKHFTQIGAGLWASNAAGLPLYDLERSR